MLVLYGIILIVMGWLLYRIFLDPLSRIPGPFISKFLPIGYIRMTWNGDHIFALKALHDTYGPVVRLGPSNLSFATTTAFDSIYGFTGEKSFVIVGGRRNLLVPDKLSDFMLAQSAAKEVRSWLRPVITSTLSEITGSCAERFLNIAFAAGLERHQAGQTRTIDLCTLNDDWMWDLGSLLAHGRHATRSTRIQFDNLVNDEEYFMCLLELCACVLHRFTIQHYLDFIHGLWALFSRFRGLHTQRDDFIDSLTAASGPGPIAAEDSHYARIQKAMEKARVEDISGTFEEFNSLSTHFNIYGSMHSAVNTAFSYLLKHPRCLRKLEEELLHAFQSYDEVTDPRLAKLPYLNACITESFRIMPPFNSGILQRVSMGQTVDGIYVPAGTGVQVDQFSLALSKEHWEAPDEFLPERWLDSTSRKNEKACRPFLIGSRQCPGKGLAYQTFRLAIGKMIYLYEIELVNKDFDVNHYGESRLAWTNGKLIVEMNPRVPGVLGYSAF
ncbi:cytochrome P450 [Xylaria telfairii]|nr:cytochrome P450 [Xylaria telfairii]